MVLDYYNLHEQPFGVTPDPRYLYSGLTHREALASLAYGVQSGRGIMSLIASPGLGKTTVLNRLLEQFKSSARIVCLSRALRQPEDILRAVGRDLVGGENEGDFVRMDARLNEVLLAEARQGRKVILVIDESQNLDEAALEQVRLLSNFETGSEKLIQIILSGQPQLREKLAAPGLVQLRQRMSIMARLEPLDARDTRLYIDHRLRAAGYQSNDPLFTSAAEALITQYSAGIPRNINNICFNALSLGCVLKEKPIGEAAVREVLHDLELVEPEAPGAYIAPAGPGIFEETQRNLARRPSFAWQRLAAVSATLLLGLLGALLVAPGGWRRVEARVLRGARTPAPAPTAPALPPAKAESSSEAPGKAVASQTPREPTFSTPSREPNPVALTEDKKPGKSFTMNPAGSTDPGSTDPGSTDQGSTDQGSTDPGKLWKQVKKQDSDAEVALAQMYLDGTEVPQNCQQAQVLLLAASKKGNARALEMLNHYADKCH